MHPLEEHSSSEADWSRSGMQLTLKSGSAGRGANSPSPSSVWRSYPGWKKYVTVVQSVATMMTAMTTRATTELVDHRFLFDCLASSMSIISLGAMIGNHTLLKDGSEF